jgi:hypothetical protein
MHRAAEMTSHALAVATGSGLEALAEALTLKMALSPEANAMEFG